MITALYNFAHANNSNKPNNAITNNRVGCLEKLELLGLGLGYKTRVYFMIYQNHPPMSVIRGSLAR